MRILNLLSSVDPVLVCLAAPDDAAGGTSTPPATPPEPTGTTLEEKFTSAKTIIADFFKQLGGAMRERDEAVTNLATVTAERDGAVTKRDELQGQVTSLTSERDGLKTQVTGLTTERDTARNRVTLVESFAKGHGLDVSGIPATGATPAIEEPGSTSKEGKAAYDQWQALKQDSKKSKEAASFFKKNKAAIQEYVESQDA